MAQHPPLGLVLSVGARSGLQSSTRVSSPAVLGSPTLSLSIVWDLGSGTLGSWLLNTMLLFSIFGSFGNFLSWIPSSAPPQLQLLAILILCRCPAFSPVIRAMSSLLLPRDIWAEVISVASLLCNAGILTFPLWLTPYLIGSGWELREWKYAKCLEQCMANGKHPVNLNSFLLSSPHYLTLSFPRGSFLLPERQAISVSFFFKCKKQTSLLERHHNRPAGKQTSRFSQPKSP